MELKQNMYIRTKQGDIDKLDYKLNESKFWETKTNGVIYEEDIVKASANKIDIICSGDYVNGSRVSCIKKDENGVKWVYLDSENKYNLKNEEIDSIVTRQQFKRWEYED